MPIDYARYGAGWRDFSYAIRFTRAREQCECTGQCGLHQPNPCTRRCEERHHRPARWAKGLVRLTTAHLCTCDPPCHIPEHVIAACQRCHLRIDHHLHLRHRQERASAT
jgi:hypothetical protein